MIACAVFLAVSFISLYLSLRFPKISAAALVIMVPLTVASLTFTVFTFQNTLEAKSASKRIPKCGNDPKCLKKFASRLDEQSDEGKKMPFVASGTSAAALAIVMVLIRRRKFSKILSRKAKELEEKAEIHASINETRERLTAEYQDGDPERFASDNETDSGHS